MKYLKIFENYQTEEEIAKICEKYRIRNWSINKDGLVDVNDDVYLGFKGLTELPIKFGIVSGYFYCYRNNLTTLKGAPQSVGDGFSCSDNNLTTLEGAPESVGSFSCSNNNLTTLEGAPESGGVGFYCHHNSLTTLEGAPESVDGYFDCSWNKLTTLQGAPKSVGGDFLCSNNKLPSLIKRHMKSINHIIANQEMYHIYNHDGSINKYRFKLMMDSMD